MLESSQRKSGSFKAVYILIVRSGIMMEVSFIFVRLNFILVVENLVLSVGGRWYLIFVQCVIRINSKVHWVWLMLKSVPSKKKKITGIEDKPNIPFQIQINVDFLKT